MIFGGSFDPPHGAHVVLPKYAADVIGANRVLYIPAAKAPHKLDRVQTPPHHRLAMLRLALADAPWAETCTLEMDRAQAAPNTPSYTVDTLAALTAQFPNRRLRLLIGSDQLMIFPQWKDWQTVVELAEPVVMVRPPHTSPEEVLAQLPKELNPAEWAPRLINLPPSDTSSTDIRQRVAVGEDVGLFVGFGVAAYIQEHNLYRP